MKVGTRRLIPTRIAPDGSQELTSLHKVPVHHHGALSIVRHLHQNSDPMPVLAHLPRQLCVQARLQVLDRHHRLVGQHVLSHDLDSLYSYRRLLGSLHYGCQVLWVRRSPAGRVHVLFCRTGCLELGPRLHCLSPAGTPLFQARHRGQYSRLVAVFFRHGALVGLHFPCPTVMGAC